MRRALATVIVDDRQLARPRHRDATPARIDDRRQLAIFDRAVRHRLEVRGLVELGGAADVEGPHRQLRARLTDRLRGDDADRLADVDRRAAGEIAPVAGGADAADALADQRRADLHRLRADRLDPHDRGLVEQRALGDEHLVGLAVDDVLRRGAAEDALAEAGDGGAALDDRLHLQRTLGAAIDLDDDAILRHVDQTAGEVARVRRLQRRIREALAGAVGGVEIFEDGEAFLEVRDDRRLDDLARGLGHQAAHAGELLDLRRRTTRTRMRHHVDGVHRLLATIFLVLDRLDLLHHLGGDPVTATRPGVDDLVVLLLLRDQAVLILLLVILHERAGLLDQRHLGGGDDHVVLAERDARLERVAEAERHDRVGEQHRVLLAGVTIDLVDHVADVLLGQHAVDRVEGHLERLGQALADQHAAGRRLVALEVRLAVLVGLRDAADDLRMQRHRLGVERLMHLHHVGDHHALAGLLLLGEGEVIEPEHHVLRGHDDRLAVGGREDVVGRHHQHARFQLRLEAQGHVDGHLIAVEIGVERRADQRVKLDRLALDQHGLERLDAETVERRRAVEHHGMLADHLVEDVPDFLALLLDPLLRLLEGHRETLGVEARVDERLEQLERHLLGQAALVQLEFRPGHDHRTARIVDALAEQILAEAALLALEHVGQRLQGPLVGARDRAAAAAVVEQRVDRLPAACASRCGR